VAGWGILQLKDLPDPIPVDVLERDLRHRWEDVECWFPAVREGYLDSLNPLSAYVFVRTPLSTRLETSPYVQRILRDTRRQLQKVTDEELAAMTSTVELPPVGAVVQATKGDWSGLTGRVVHTNCTSVDVLIELWSRRSVVTLAAGDFHRVYPRPASPSRPDVAD